MTLKRVYKETSFSKIALNIARSFNYSNAKISHRAMFFIEIETPFKRS